MLDDAGVHNLRVLECRRPARCLWNCDPGGGLILSNVDVDVNVAAVSIDGT